MHPCGGLPSFLTLSRPLYSGLWLLAAWMILSASATYAQAVAPASAANAAASLPVIDALSSPSSEWIDLTNAQQRALRPLEHSWVGIDEAQRRKWLSLSRNFSSLTIDEQTKLHSRMREWAALSPHERIQARLNFAETRKVLGNDKLAKWEAYQALSPEEKRKLAASAPMRPPGAAPAIKPLPQKLVTPVAPASSAASHPPGTAATGRMFALDRVDPKTLLPLPQFRSKP